MYTWACDIYKKIQRSSVLNSYGVLLRIHRIYIIDRTNAVVELGHSIENSIFHIKVFLKGINPKRPDLSRASHVQGDISSLKVTHKGCKSCRLPQSKILKFDPQRRRLLWYFCILQYVIYKCCNIGYFSDLSSSYKFIINWFCSRILI